MRFLRQWFLLFLVRRSQPFPSGLKFRGSDPEEDAGCVRTGPQALGLRLVSRGLRVQSQVQLRAPSPALESESPKRRI